MEFILYFFFLKKCFIDILGNCFESGIIFEWLAVGMDDESVLFQTVYQIKTSNIWAPN